MTADLAGEVRAICLALPEVTERPSHGAPTWFVRDKKAFVTLWAHGHHADDFPHLWCAGLPGAQHELVTSGPGRFFRPPYVGGRGWIGVRLDGEGFPDLRVQGTFHGSDHEGRGSPGSDLGQGRQGAVGLHVE